MIDTTWIESFTSEVSIAISIRFHKLSSFRCSTIAATSIASRDALVFTTPAALDTKFCDTSNTAIEKVKALLTNHTAIHILIMYLKKSNVSVSECILFFSMTMFISSMHKTAVMIIPAMGITTVSLIFFTKLNTSAFQPLGVFPTSVATRLTFSFISKNIASRFAWIIPIKIS